MARSSSDSNAICQSMLMSIKKICYVLKANLSTFMVCLKSAHRRQVHLPPCVTINSGAQSPSTSGFLLKLVASYDLICGELITNGSVVHQCSGTVYVFC